MLTGIWSANKIVNTMNVRREVPTNYSNALKANIKTKINARANINSDRKKRAVGALNVLFNKKPVLRPEPITENWPENTRSSNSSTTTRQPNVPMPTYKEHLRQMGNY
jgi:hypothetical protein